MGAQLVLASPFWLIEALRKDALTRYPYVVGLLGVLGIALAVLVSNACLLIYARRQAGLGGRARDALRVFRPRDYPKVVGLSILVLLPTFALFVACIALVTLSGPALTEWVKTGDVLWPWYQVMLVGVVAPALLALLAARGLVMAAWTPLVAVDHGLALWPAIKRVYRRSAHCWGRLAILLVADGVLVGVAGGTFAVVLRWLLRGMPGYETQGMVWAGIALVLLAASAIVVAIEPPPPEHPLEVPLRHQAATGGALLTKLALLVVWLLPWTQLARGEAYVRLFGLGPLGQQAAKVATDSSASSRRGSTTRARRYLAALAVVVVPAIIVYAGYDLARQLHLGSKLNPSLLLVGAAAVVWLATRSRTFSSKRRP